MECLYSTCSAKTRMDADRFMMCWICKNVAHLKCAGLKGPILDVILKSVGVKWSCPSCREVEINFARHIARTSDGYNEMRKSVRKILNRIDADEKLLHNFNYADLCPKRKRSNVSDMPD